VLAPTYYPGTPDKDAARVIAVRSAQTVERASVLDGVASPRIRFRVWSMRPARPCRAIVMLMIDPNGRLSDTGDGADG